MKSVNCPICDGKAELHIEQKRRTFRKEEFQVFEYYYKCTSCNEEFTTTHTDELNVNQVYNQYREKHSIPFPEELQAKREKYKLSAAKMSEVLGLGANQYRLYEEGEMPSLSNGTLLSIIMNTNEFKNIILKKKDTLNNPDKVLGHLDNLITQEKFSNIDVMQLCFSPSETLNKYNGYTIPSFDKFAHMVLFFISNAHFKTRLNKFLFYSDFAYYKYYGRSISGSEYKAIQKGPVPKQYDYKFGLLNDKNIISSEIESYNKIEAEKFIAKTKFEESLFNKPEIEIMESVLDCFRYKKTEEIIKISHDEIGWINNKDNSPKLISYQDYAPKLIAL